MRGLPLILLAFLLAGCAVGGSKDSPESGGDDGLTRYEISSGHFSIAVPDTWHATTSTQMQKAAFKQFARENPGFRPYAEAAARKNSPLKLVAYDPVIRKRFVTNVNVVVSPTTKKFTAQTLRRALAKEAKTLASSKVRATDVSLPAGKAVRLQYRARFTFTGRRTLVSTLQYSFLLDKKLYVLTYTSLPAYAAEYDWAFRKSAASFRLAES
jgi:hypothetical protein